MRNLIRRSRKIGLTQGGRVRSGKAWPKPSRILTDDTWRHLAATAREGKPRIIIENPSRDYFHPCSASEILEVLGRFPEDVLKPVRVIVLRRLPGKDHDTGIEARAVMSCVVLNAFPKTLRQEWESLPSARVIRHYKPWCQNWVAEGRRHVLAWTTDEIKRYYLYHLLLHEIGHLIDPRKRSARASESFAEDFALRYARQLNVAL
jgi:hypothetical protein